MNVITSVNDKYFSLNGIKYVRNYLPKPYGTQLEIYNCYDRKDVLITRTSIANFMVNGVAHNAVDTLQAALLDVIYNRNFGTSLAPATVKPVKIITAATTGFNINTYTLQPEDDKKWLVFNLVNPYIIKIPTGVFTVNSEFECETIGNGLGTFSSETGITIFYGASNLAKTAERYSVFGMKFRSVNEVSLFGKLELA